MHQRFLAFILTGCLTCCHAFGQDTQSFIDQLYDSLGYQPTLVFAHKSETEIFSQYFAEKPLAILPVFLSTDPKENPQLLQKADEALQTLYRQLASSKIDRKPFKKQLELIFEETHGLFLNKYVESSLFSGLFETGTYNCLTATALYAHILTQYGIEFFIKEAPTHVYLVAKNGAEQTVFETTDPQSGYYFLNEKAKTEYLNYLLKQKIISEDEYRNHTIDELFNLHYFSEKEITPIQLAGLQYYNQAVWYAEKNDFVNAKAYLEKAYTLYPCQKIKYHLLSATASYFTQTSYEHPAFPLMLAALINLSASSQNLAEIQQACREEYRLASQALLIQNGKAAEFDSISTHLMGGIADSVVARDFRQIFVQQKGRYFLFKEDFASALPLLLEAQKGNPQNVEIQSQVNHAFAGLLKKNIEKGEAYIDSLYEAARFTIASDQASRQFQLSYLTSKANKRYADRDYEKTLELCLEIYELEPNTPGLTSTIAQSVIHSISVNAVPEDVIKELANYELRYPALTNNPGFAEARILTLCALTEIAFRNDRISEATNHLDEIENLAKDHPVSDIGQRFMAQLYWEGAAYYIRLQNYTQARHMVIRGLEKGVSTGFLTEKLRVIDQLMGN